MIIRPSSDSRRSILVHYAGGQPAGTLLTYEDIAIALGIDEDDDRVRKIQAAKGDAWLELGDLYGRALVARPGLGYEVVTGSQFFAALLVEVSQVLKRVRRIAKRFDHVSAEQLTTAQRDARTSIAGRLRIAWSDIRKDYRRGFLQELPEDMDDVEDEDPTTESAMHLRCADGQTQGRTEDHEVHADT